MPAVSPAIHPPHVRGVWNYVRAKCTSGQPWNRPGSHMCNPGYPARCQALKVKLVASSMMELRSSDPIGTRTKYSQLGMSYARASTGT